MIILIRFYKRSFFPIINKWKNFVSLLINNSYFSKNYINKRVINIISYTFLCIIIYLFRWNLKIFKIFQIFIFSIISFAISLFIFDNFKLSNDKFIKFLQKFGFTNSIFALIVLILYLYLLDVSIFNTEFWEKS